MTRVERIGAATLYLGDCRDVLPTLSGVDAVVTDPPFGVRDDAWDAMDDYAFARFSMGWISQCAQVADEMVAFGITSSAVHRLCEMAFPEVRPLIWHKPLGSELRSASERRFYGFEVVFHCRKSQREVGSDNVVGLAIQQAREAAGLSRGAVDIRIRGKRTGLCFRWEEGACLPTPEQAAMLLKLLPLGSGFRTMLEHAYTGRAETAKATDVLTYRTVTEGRHPCEKPVGLMADILSITGQNWATIADPFMGVGSSGVACVNLGRGFVGIEQNARYFDIACRRIEQAQRQADLFVPHPDAPRAKTTDLFAEGAA